MPTNLVFKNYYCFFAFPLKSMQQVFLGTVDLVKYTTALSINLYLPLMAHSVFIYTVIAKLV